MDDAALQKEIVLPLQKGMKATTKRYLHVLGGALGIIGVFFVAERLLKYSDQIHLNRFSLADWILLLFLTCLYSAANLFLAAAWQRLLAFLGAPVSERWAIQTYAVSLLAKYVPGNIFQFAGRQAIGMGVGISGQILLKSTLYELGLLAVVGGTFGVLTTSLLWTHVPQPPTWVCFSVLIFGIAWCLRRYWSPNIASAWWFYALFLAASGMVFWGTLWVISPEHPPPSLIATIGGAYVLAWLAGLVTPGAPAGVGVREGMLLLLLGDLIAPDYLLLAVVMSRTITVAGDLLFFFFFSRFSKISR